MNIELKVANQQIDLAENANAVDSSQNYLYLHFTLTDEWKACTTILCYFQNNSYNAKTGTAIQMTVDKNTCLCSIPDQVNVCPGFWINLVGRATGDVLIVTKMMTISLSKAGTIIGNEGSVTPIDNIYLEIMKAISEKDDTTDVDEKLSKAIEALTKASVGLDKVDNTSDKDKPISDATQHALDDKQENLVNQKNIKSVCGYTLIGEGDVDLKKADIGLSNVDNTADLKKPVSEETQKALDKKLDSDTATNTYATKNALSDETTARINGDANSISTSNAYTDNKVNALTTSMASAISALNSIQKGIDSGDTSAAAVAASVSGVTDKTVRNMLHLGYYDTYIIDANGNYVVTRQTGYLNITADTPILSPGNLQNGNPDLWYSAPGAIFEVKSTTNNIKSNWLVLGNGPQYLGNYSAVASYYKSQPFVIVSVADATTTDQIKTYVSSHPLFIQYKLATPYTETYDPLHFARIQPYALEHAKSEADRSSNLTKVNSSSGVSSVILSSSLQSGQYTLSLSCGTDDAFTILSGSTAIGTHTAGTASFSLTFTISSVSSISISGTAGSYAYSNIMLNRGSVALPYQPYEGKTVHETGLPLLFIGEATASTAVSTLTSAGNDYFLVPFGSALASGLDASSVSHSFGATNGHVTTAGTMSVNINGIAVDLVSLANFRIYSYAD